MPSTAPITRKSNARAIATWTTFHVFPRSARSAQTNIQTMAMKAGIPPMGRWTLEAVRSTDHRVHDSWSLLSRRIDSCIGWPREGNKEAGPTRRSAYWGNDQGPRRGM